MNKKLSFFAFTLVELIVVITILAILATIAFISLQGYSRSARDSARLNDVRVIEKGLSFFEIRNNTLPLPDDYITITASGTAISYQGYTGTGMLAAIGQAGEIIDPLLDEAYTYTVATNRRSFQLLAYLERQVTAHNIFPQIPQTYANNHDVMYPRVFGDSVGILTLSDNSPIPLSSDIEIVGLGDGVYSYHIENTKSFSTDESMILHNTLVNKELASVDSSLVGFWDMRTLYSTGGINYLKDFSGNGNHGICTESYWENLGCNQGNGGPRVDVNEGTIFDGVNDHVNIGTSPSALIEFSLVTRFNISGGAYHSSLIGNSGTSLTGVGYFYGRSNTKTLWVIIYDSSGSQHQYYNFPNSIIENNKDYIATLTYKEGRIRMYLNDFLVHEASIDGFLPNSNDLTSIGKERSSYWPIQGTISEVRIYNRELTGEEINYINNNGIYVNE